MTIPSWLRPTSAGCWYLVGLLVAWSLTVFGASPDWRTLVSTVSFLGICLILRSFPEPAEEKPEAPYWLEAGVLELDEVGVMMLMKYRPGPHIFHYLGMKETVEVLDRLQDKGAITYTLKGTGRLDDPLEFNCKIHLTRLSPLEENSTDD